MGAAPDSLGPELTELAPGDARLPEALRVMGELRTGRSAAELERLHAEAHARSGYRIVALFEAGECRAVAGFRILTNLAHGRFLYVDDLVTSERWRSRGYGRRLDAHLREIAAAAGCGGIGLDSGVGRHRAHRFYFRLGYAIESFHFGRRLGAHRIAAGPAEREEDG